MHPVCFAVFQMDNDDLNDKLFRSDQKHKGLVQTAALLQQNAERFKQKLTDVRTPSLTLGHAPTYHIECISSLCRVKRREHELNEQCLRTRYVQGLRTHLSLNLVVHSLTSVVLLSP